MSQKNDIHGPGKGKEERVSNFKSPVLPYAQTAKARFIRIQFVKNAAFIMGNK
jgi:hypothetical protein